MRTPILTMVVLTFLLTGLAPAQENGLEKALKSPPATGFLVTQVVPESQAGTAGIQVGDVIVSYDGTATPDVQTLGAAKAGAAGKEQVEIRVMRGAELLSFQIAPGPIGVNGLAVKKGVPAQTLPADTGVRFDFSGLKDAPLDLWYDFHLKGRPEKVGFEHGVVRLEGNELHLRREVAFDGGPQWGVNHFDVTVVATADPLPRAVRTRFASPLRDWVGEGEHVFDTEKEPNLQWRFEWSGDESGKRDMEAPLDFLPTYLIETLVTHMPREKGACFRFHAFDEGWPQPGSPQSALVCRGRETIEHDGSEVECFKYVWMQFGGQVSNTYWIGPDGEPLRIDYGGAYAVRTTREKALAGLPEKIVPQTAGEAGKTAPSTPATPLDPLDRVLADPPVTGLLVVRVIPGTQADRLGIEVGDVVVEYGGEATPTYASIGVAKSHAEGRDHAEIRVHRDDADRLLIAEPGSIGIIVLEVQKGAAVDRLPADTEAGFDFSGLEGEPEVAWFGLEVPQLGKIGFVKARVRLAGERLFLDVETVYGGETFAEITRIQTTEALSIASRPRPIMSRIEGPEGTVSGILKPGDAEWPRWTELSGGGRIETPVPADVVTVEILPTLASAMPLRAGACFRFTPLRERSGGGYGNPSALVVVGEEEIDHHGKPTKAWRLEWRELGAEVVSATYWVAPTRELLRIELPEVVLVRGSEEEALEGLPAKVRPEKR